MVSRHAPRPDGNAVGMANAHMHRNRRRGRDWPDLVGRCDVQVGPREQRRHVGCDIVARHHGVAK